MRSGHLLVCTTVLGRPGKSAPRFTQNFPVLTNRAPSQVAINLPPSSPPFLATFPPNNTVSTCRHTSRVTRMQFWTLSPPPFYILKSLPPISASSAGIGYRAPQSVTLGVKICVTQLYESYILRDLLVRYTSPCLCGTSHSCYSNCFKVLKARRSEKVEFWE